MPSYFVPLSRLFPTDIVPVDLFTLPAAPALFDTVGVTDYRVETTPRGVYFRADLALDPNGDADPTLVLALPQFPDLGLAVTSLGRLEVWFQADFKARLSVGACAIRLPSELLQPAREADDGSWEADSSRDYVEIGIDYSPFADELPSGERDHPIVLSVDGQGRLDLEYTFQRADGGTVVPIVSLNGPAMIAESGLVIEAGNIALNFDPENPIIVFGEAFLRLPPNLLGSVVLPDVLFENATLSRRGFSGSVTASWQLAYENDRFVYHVDGTTQNAELFALHGGLRHISLAFAENRITASDIAGGLIVPYFDEPVNIRLNLTATGDFIVTLMGVDEDGITLTKEELIALNIQSLTVAKEGNLASIEVSGGLEPLLMAADGLEWPRLDVKELSIEQDITDLTKPPILKFKEAWLDLKDLATLDLWGFHFELNRVGLGYEEPRDRLWVDLTGSLRLIEQIPVGLGVEGFRLSWPRTLYEMLNIQQAPTLKHLKLIAAQLEVKFDGLYIFFGVPQAVEFEGYIRFIKEAKKIGFAGDVVLRMPASGFSLEAGLMVGMNFAEPYPYPFLYVYLGVELPSGIPLGQSGLALKGALGLFGLNVVPDKTAEQNWYYDWYKRGPFVGAHQTNKWKDEFLALAVGIGVTITTTDGYIKGVRGLLVLAIPGPILMIEGRSLIFDGLLPGEPPLRAMAIFDGRERIIQFNVEAEATIIEDMLDAYGMLEAFFDFKDLTNWHLYLGQDEPRDRRIQANIIKFKDAFLFKADAYLMVDMIGSHSLRSRMGVFVGFKPPIPSFGPVQITLDAVLEGDGVVTVLPEQFTGEIGLSATVKLQAFGFGLQMVAGAGVLTEGPRPLKVDAEVYIKAEFPLPLAPLQFLPDWLQEAIPEIPPLEVEAKLELSWQAPEPPEIVPPLVSITADSPFVPGGGALTIRERQAVNTTWQSDAEKSPVVPIDTRPVLAFTHEMNDAAKQPGPAFARHPDGCPKHFDVGFMRFTPTVTAVRLYEHRKGEPWPDNLDGWTLVASSQASEQNAETNRLLGVWMSEADPHGPDRPTTRRLQLWTTNPLLHANIATGPGYSPMSMLVSATFSQAPPLVLRQSHSEALLDLYPDLHECAYGEPQRVCVSLNTPAPTPDQPGQSWSYEDIRFIHADDGRAGFINTGGTNLLPPPTLDPRSLRLLQRDLATIDPSLARLPPSFSLAQLKQWTSSVYPARQKIIRQQLPQWQQVWNWLWPVVRPPRICLHLSGTMHTIQFPEPVRQVWITFCQPPEVDPSHVPDRLETRRAAHGLAELLQIRDEARAKRISPDFRRCLGRIDHQVEINADRWVISADDAFDCLTLVRMGEFAIAEICYLTAAELERATRATEQCETNEGPPPPDPILEPGSYYRLEVDTTIIGELIIPPPGVKLDQRIVNVLETLYEKTLKNIGLNGSQTYEHIAFFQTEGPPTHLARYIKWTSPEPQALRVFRDDDFSIRFLRANVEAMFSHPCHKLKLLLRSAEGRLIDGYDTDWDIAGSASLLHEEHLWRQHTNAQDPPPGDDLLVARRTNAQLEPRARYDLLLTGGDGGEMLFRDRFEADFLPEIWQGNRAGWSVDHKAGTLQRQANSAGTLLAGDPGWDDIDIGMEIRLPSSFGSAGLLLRTRETFFAGANDPIWHGCRLRLRRLLGQENQLELRLEALRQEPSGSGNISTRALTAHIAAAPTDAWIQLRIVVVANHLQVWVFDKKVFDGSLYVIADVAPGNLLWFVGGLDSVHQEALQERRLMPSAQGAIGLYASRSGPSFRRLRVRDAVLDKVSFTTSAFAGFSELVGSAAAPIDVPAGAPNGEIRNAAINAAENLAQARRSWERGQADFRFEWINREELEDLRLALREARAKHDADFRKLAEDVSQDLNYLPLASHIEVYRLKNNSQVTGIWLRSPESLDLRQEVRNSSGSPVGYVGRTTWVVERQQGGIWSVQAWQACHDADSTQVIFLPSDSAISSGNYRIRFDYHRDHGDENNPDAKHGNRYDRPIEQRNGGSAPAEEVEPMISF